MSIFSVVVACSACAQGVYIGADNGSSANASAILDLDVSAMTEKKGVLLPRVSEAEKLEIASPATGLMVFQNDVQPGFYYYDGTTWTSIGSGWGLSGNAGIDAALQYLGTSDASDMVLRTNAMERLRLDADGTIRYKSETSSNELRFYEPSGGANYTAFRSPALSSDVVYTLPDTQGNVGEVLTNDGSGNLSWTVPIETPAVTAVQSVIVPNGSSNDDIDIGTATFIHMSGSNSNFDVTGFQGGSNGKILIVYNTGNGHMRIRNEDSGSAAENRIWTLQGGSGVLQTTAQGAVTFVYDGQVQRWIAVGIND
ncbi:MAG: hypothetical protein GC178_13415 [Flavobacteriales bacterium]|nr:hypothetical protein [Flavobacteriales bacterium]